jgi:hypothetical protein
MSSSASLKNIAVAMAVHIREKLQEEPRALPIINQLLDGIYCYKNGCMRNPIGHCTKCGNKEDDGR